MLMRRRVVAKRPLALRRRRASGGSAGLPMLMRRRVVAKRPLTLRRLRVRAKRPLTCRERDELQRIAAGAASVHGSGAAELAMSPRGVGHLAFGQRDAKRPR